MFNLQGSELIIILLLALVVLGPEKLPDAMRKAGQFYAELKKMSTGFQNEFRAAVDEPLRELRETANTIRDSADFTKFQAGEREEKPKSAEMLAAADPDAVPTDELPFQPADSEATEPAVEPAPPSPSEQEPFMPIKFTGGSAERATASTDATPPAPTGQEPVETIEPAGSSTPNPETPAPFSGSQVSSASVPIRAPAAPDAGDTGNATADHTSHEAAGDAQPQDVGDVDPDDAAATDLGTEEASG